MGLTSLRAQQDQAAQQKLGVEPWSDNAPQPRLMLTFGDGLNENIDPALTECTSGQNFDLAYAVTSLQPRAPFDLTASAPNAGSGTGLMQLVKRDNTQTTLSTHGNKVYQWDGTASGFTSKATVTAPAYFRDSYWSLGDYLVITDVQLNNVVMTWDGTTFGALTTGLGAALYAKYGIVHNNRVWLFNIKSGATLFPDMILACKFEDPTTWDTSTRGGPTTVGGGSFSTGLEPFYLLVPDLKPINGVALFQNILIISTLGGRIWELTGSSSSTYQFQDFYDTAPSIGDECMTSIGNDVVFVRQGGAIALLSATQAFGSAFTSNLAAWLPITTKNMGTPTAIVYDVLNQKVLFFLPNFVLVLFKDKLAQDRYKVEGTPSPWSKYTTNYPTGFNTNAVKYMLVPGTTMYTVFWADEDGDIFNMNGVGSGDAGTNLVPVSRTSRHIGIEAVNPWPWTEENITGHLRYSRLTPLNASISLTWDDEYNIITTSVALKGPLPSNQGFYYSGNGYYNAANYYNQGFGASSLVSSINLELGGKGPGFYITVSLPTNDPTQVRSVELD